MCGIAGILHWGRAPDAVGRARHMADALRHRGPDGDGYWQDADIALGFRRLAILDLATGDQPMPNEDGRVQVVCNGEIYNHRELRATLTAAGHTFRSDHSDTEVLVHGWEQWGEDLLPRLNGMFAFALWDQRHRELVLCRDRLGIKPLYLHETAHNGVIFGSEVRALQASGFMPSGIDAAAVLETFSFMNIWGGRTPYTGVRMLEPGTCARFRPDRKISSTFWRMTFNRRQQQSDQQEVERFAHVLEQAVRSQMAADVPVATYLSGGIDSSAITALAHQVDATTRAYSCIFDITRAGADATVDEREFSRAAAGHIGIERVEHSIAADALIAQLGRTVEHLEYPRMGMAYVNDLLAERVAKDGKVVLSGLGGDEFTGGYVGRYASVPHRYRQQPAAGLRARLRSMRELATGRQSGGAPDDPLSVYRRALNVPLPWTQRDGAFTPDFLREAKAFDADAVIADVIATAPSGDPWDIVMYVDATTYLHGLLVLEDKLSMAHGLETRVPLLDNTVIDHLLDVDWRLLSDGIEGKKLFRRAAARWVPDAIARKPKMGFAPPDASWYRGALQPFVETILAPAKISRRGVFKPAFVARVLGEHAAGAANHVALIWSLMCFETWCDANGAFGGR